MSTMHRQLLAIREHELCAVRPFLEPGTRVLELGAGSGWQASRLVEWGHVVRALDIVPPPDGGFFPVEQYDGRRLPVADASVDVVYSSNVLEHVVDLPGLLDETRRVLTGAGRAVHVLPSAVWRVWSLAARYPFLVRVLAHRVLSPGQAAPERNRGTPDAQEGVTGLKLVRRALVEPAHGEFPSAISELHHYRAAQWIAKFNANGFVVTEVRPVELFYTSYGLSTLTLAHRARIARLLGSSGTIFVLQPA
jgi:SAM-dependent methyltransferase